MATESRGSECTTLQEMVLASENGTQPRSVQLFEIGTQLALDTGALTSFEAASGDPSPYGRTPGGPHRSVVVQTCTVPSFMPAAQGAAASQAKRLVRGRIDLSTLDGLERLPISSNGHGRAEVVVARVVLQEAH